MNRFYFFFLLASMVALPAFSQRVKKSFNHLDTLFGSNTPQRIWWDVKRYDIEVTPDYATKTIQGRNTISYTVVADKPDDYLQVDLQKPLQIDSIYYNGKAYINYPPKPYYNEGDHYFIPLPFAAKNSLQKITLVYHGKPKEAKNPPWDGGWVWTKDAQGRNWMSVACEDDGASLWYPCKDTWSDEPDNGVSLTITVPDSLTVVANGKLQSQKKKNGLASFRWEVKSPINAYDVVPYIGHYINWSDTMLAEKGILDLNFWVLDYELENAKKQFTQVKPTIKAFEHWFGPYPFYQDGYQLIQAPYLGMEHQSAVAYGNQFKNGYLGGDLSGTGWGLKWDYIIVHETGHEWFGNSLTAKDMADMWVHEGFTDYSETLFIDDNYGKQAGDEYVQGLRRSIENDRPIIGPYGVHQSGSGDMYFKGANLLHNIRQIINDDEKFRTILRGLNKEFYQQTITTKQVEEYISKQSGIDFSKVFDQYLRTAMIPILQTKKNGLVYQYKWSNVIGGFTMPVKLTTGQWLKPTSQWQTITLKNQETFGVDKNFYINCKAL